MTCETLLPSIGVSILLFFSEILPFVSTVEANGVIDFGVKILLKYFNKKKKDLETGEENENGVSSNTGSLIILSGVGI